MPLNGPCGDIVRFHATGVFWPSLVLGSVQPRRRSEEYRVRYTRIELVGTCNAFILAGHRQRDFVLLLISVTENLPLAYGVGTKRKFPTPCRGNGGRYQRKHRRPVTSERVHAGGSRAMYQHKLFGDLETAMLNHPPKFVGHSNVRAVSH